MNKKMLTERDICTKYITPSVIESGWDIMNQIKEEVYFTDGRITVRGKIVKRGKGKRADYILFYKPNLPIAVIEAKDNKHLIGDGIQQAISYANILDIPFAYSSNGDGFIEYDRLNGTEKELGLNEFPSPEELWSRYKVSKGINDKEESIITQDYYYSSNIKNKTPRYYQRIAINRTVEAIVKGQNRILLVMATGTGKTYTAFQIMHRLWKSKNKKKILFLADRNILIDQTMQNDFQPFQNVMTKVTKGHLDSSYEIFLALYQQLSGDSNISEEETFEVFKQFSPDFFDLIIVDECHRGSASESSAWRRILEYFYSATQIGLTATPKEEKNISNSAYFGEPIYTYSLKQGIEDGFLAPYKVIRVGLDTDLEGYIPEKGKVDVNGNTIVQREYNSKDFDKTIIIDDRTRAVAKSITDYLKETNRFDKTIVFCVNVNHAERMRRALIEYNSDLMKEDNRYIMRITGDNAEGKAQLDNFIDEDSKYPTIVTTSKLMTTGVDCKTCKLIVLDNNIGSMTEFKQIIGRGTRLKESHGKEFFTIMDFRNNCRNFQDPEFDGEPVQIYEPKHGQSLTPPDDYSLDSGEASDNNKNFDNFNISIYNQEPVYRVNDVEVKILNKTVRYLDENGNLITESLIDYTRKNMLNNYATLDDFLNNWKSTEKKSAILKELEEQGIFVDALREDIGKDLDDFDVICHIAFDKVPLTRKERADNVKKRGYLYKYSDMAQKVLEALLDKYSDEGIAQIETIKVLECKPFDKFGSPSKIIKAFGGKKEYLSALNELEEYLYAVA